MEKDQIINMDPNLLISIINMKLRDFYSSLDSLCEDIGIEKIELEEKLKNIGYKYDEVINQFR